MANSDNIDSIHKTPDAQLIPVLFNPQISKSLKVGIGKAFYRCPTFLMNLESVSKSINMWLICYSPLYLDFK